MRRLATILLTVFSLTFYGQTIKEMKPTLGKLIDKSSEGEIEFNKKIEQCEKVWKKVSKSDDYKKLTSEEKKIYDNCDEADETYWEILGSSCSWYCGGGLDTATASSELKPFKGVKYAASNIDDLNYKTAWIEGVPGYGIGENITLHFPPENPRITKIIIVNGYVKSERAWRENSRVKKLKMYLYNKPFAILNLVDTRQEQTFTFEPIGYSDRKDWKKLSTKPWWTMKFEILEVYQGEKFDDTAITEIYFDGIDVHCFGAGTKILMSDNSTKDIETIKKGDKIKTYNFLKEGLQDTEVTKTINRIHSNLYKLVFKDREIISTDDHPFWTENKKWASLNPQKSNSNYEQTAEIQNLQIGDRVFIPSENIFTELTSIEKLNSGQQTYTIELKTVDNFIANGLLVKTEKIKKTTP